MLVVISVNLTGFSYDAQLQAHKLPLIILV